MNRPKIAILGTGNVGAALGARLIERGYAVAFGSRRPEQTIAGVTGSTTLEHDRAARDAEIVFLAVPAESAADTVAAARLEPGTILVDCTNPLRFDNGPVHDPPAAGSVTAMLAGSHPELRIVKGFCTFGARRHRHPDVGGVPTDVPLASDDRDAVRAVADVARSAGFRPLDAGPLRNAAVLENVAVLWIELAQNGGLGRNFAFIALDEQN